MKQTPYNKARKAAYDQRRGNAQSRGYTSKWQRESKAWLAAHPICVECGERATLVDHIRPHKKDWKLFWDRKNWQAMCARCHNTVKASAEALGYSTKVGPDGLPIDSNHPFYR